jgi:hypothetical protein
MMAIFTKITQKRQNYSGQEKMPASQATFKEYEFNIDIASLTGDDALEEERFKNNYNMLSLNQLKDTIPILKTSYNSRIQSRATNIAKIATAATLVKSQIA